ncbi:histidine kinase [Christensenellaceae bacterium OttesenSCG-928-K19]|nr:histidine kinase [Christensenellaceae bacterium OttesenSCG-928-K19]
MRDAYMISTGLYISAIIISLVLLAATQLGRGFRQRVFHWFFYLVLFNLLGIAGEAVVGILSGYTGHAVYVAIKIADFFAYTIGAGSTIVFALYVYEYLKTKTNIAKTPVYIVYVLSAITVLLAAIAQFNDQFAWLDENNYYHQGGLLWLTYLPTILAFLTFAIVTLRHIKALKPREWIVLLVYMVMPTMCYVIEWLNEDIWLTHFGYAITTLLIYTTIQVDLMQEIKEQRAELMESRISVMLSQIQPHFLYNTLTAISDLCSDNPKASEALVTFSTYLRGNLNTLTMKGLIPFEKELEHVEQYLRLEQLRFEERLQIEYDIQATAFMMPALILQPIVENAVLHGVTQIREGGKVRIRVEETESSFRIAVEDNGAGFEPGVPLEDARGHMGIANVRARLSAMCNGLLVIESAPGEGTTAIIEIPKGKQR